MKMDDNELKRLLQEGMEYEADCIMAEVESDPSMQDVVAPEEIFDNLLKQIREREDQKEKERDTLSQEEQELIRLGKIYKKKRGRRKYIVLIAAVVCALAVGTISFGDGKKVFTEIQRMLGDRKQSVVNTDDGERSFVDDISNEEEAYQQIEEEFGFAPVKMFYLPDGMEFTEVVLEKNLQLVHLYYADGDEKSISFRVTTKYRTGSVGVDIEDEPIEEYTKEVKGTVVNIQEYKVEDSNSQRWSVNFTYNEAQYTIVLMGMESFEIERIIENLHFL